MFDIAKCAEAEKYCKDCKTCMRHKIPDEKFQCYGSPHEYKETDKDKCNFYISSIRIDSIMKDVTCPEDEYKRCEIVGQAITMMK